VQLWAGNATIWEALVKFRFVPQPVNLGNKPRCGMLEWPVFTPRSGAENVAVAKIFVLRALAAKNLLVSCGLRTVIRRFLPGFRASGLVLGANDGKAGLYCRSACALEWLVSAHRDLGANHLA
jgi:hypothetical protein